MKLRTDYAQMVEELIEKYGSIDNAVERIGVARMTLYDIRNGVTKTPATNTYIKMINGLEETNDGTH